MRRNSDTLDALERSADLSQTLKTNSFVVVRFVVFERERFAVGVGCGIGVESRGLEVESRGF